MTACGRMALLTLWWLPILPPLWELLFPGFGFIFTAPAIGINDASRSEVLMLTLVALATSGASIRFQGRSLSWPGWCALAFLAHSVVSCLTGSEILNSFFFSQGWFAAACAYLATPYLRPARPSLAVRVFWVHIPIVLICLISLTEPGERAAGPFQLPGVLASWLLMVAPLAFHEFLLAKPRTAMAALLPSILAIVTLLLTISRAAWLVMLFGFVGLLLLEGRCSWRRLLAWGCFWLLGLAGLVAIRGLFSGQGLMICVAVLASLPSLLEVWKGRIPRSVGMRAVALVAVSMLSFFLTSALRPPVSQEVTAQSRWQELSGKDNSAVSRIELWRTGLALGLKYPILGVGPGRFGEAYPQVQKLYYYYSDSAHNAICEMAAELGLLGLAIFGLWLALEGRRINPCPQEHPWQRGLFIGVVSGMIYAQVEVGYHFAYLWVVLAMIMSALSAPALPSSTGRARSLGFLGLAALPLYFWGAQRDYARSLQELTVARAYTQSRSISDRIPAWSAPALSALQYGLRDEAPLEDLRVLAQRVLENSPRTAAAYQLAADVAYREEKYPEARRLYQASLQLDPYNFPGSYHGLLLIAGRINDQAERRAIENQVLARYDLSLMPLAHPGHKAQISLQLIPLLYDVADSISPYVEPARTEPIFRFLLQEKPDPRALHGLGISLWTMGRFAEGRPYLEEAHRLNPIYPAPP